jgi:uncharacterized membrane protein YkvI
MNNGAWRIALLFSANSLGAAYLSGYEWLRFFSAYGSWGTIGIVLTGVGLTWFTYTMLRLCLQNGWSSLHEWFVHLIGPKLAPSFSVISHIVLLAHLGTVVGLQAVQYGSGRYAVLLLSALCLTAFWLARSGMSHIVRAVLLFGALGLLLVGWMFTVQRHVPIPSLFYQLTGSWLISASYYLALHVLLSLAVLLPLVSRTTDLSTLRWGMGMGGVFFFLVTMLGHAVLLANWHEINTSAQPVREILGSLLPYAAPLHAAVSLGHSCIVLAALFYGLSAPVVDRYELQLTPMLFVMLLVAALSGLLSLWIAAIHIFAYTAATYCGMFLLAMYCWKHKR